MAKVRVRPETGTLLLDFTYRGVRCREQTTLLDNATNRRIVERLLARVQREIADGSFDYAATFPGSTKASHFADPKGERAHEQPQLDGTNTADPRFGEFAKVWFAECAPQWRTSYQDTVEHILDKELVPVFGESRLVDILKPAVLAFRADLSARPCRDQTLGPARINKIMGILRQVLNEAADRFDFPAAFRRVKPLKVPRKDVKPFSLDEVDRIVETVRQDYRNYLVVRFFTGLRTGEINGLQWKYVDLDKNLILVRETIVGRRLEQNTKTDGSHRDIPMVPRVRMAIEAQLANRDADCPWVFHTRGGNPIDAVNFSNRVWHPLLRHLGLAARRPYQTRHTTATVMLAAGESPEWVARMLGHVNTEMLFRIYSRFIPNLTRQDGRAFAGLLSSHTTERGTTATERNAIDSMSVEELRTALASLLGASQNPQSPKHLTEPAQEHPRQEVQQGEHTWN